MKCSTSVQKCAQSASVSLREPWESSQSLLPPPTSSSRAAPAPEYPVPVRTPSFLPEGSPSWLSCSACCSSAWFGTHAPGTRQDDVCGFVRRCPVAIIPQLGARGYSSFTSAQYPIIGMGHPSSMLLFLGVRDASRLGAVTSEVTVSPLYVYPGLEVELLNCRVCMFMPSCVTVNRFPVAIWSCSAHAPPGLV